MRTEIDVNECEHFLKAKLDRSEIHPSQSDPLNVNAQMRTEIDLNEPENDLNECEHFLKANLDRLENDLSWIVLNVNGFKVFTLV